MSKPKKDYTVNVFAKYSKDVHVKASSMAEAKKLVWERFKENPPKNLFSFDCTERYY